MLTRFSSNIALGILVVIPFFISFFYADFVKVRIGPLFISEVLFISWLTFACLGRELFLKRILKLLWPILAFFCWGLLLLAYDILKQPELLHDPLVRMRTVQHTIIFVYPMIWAFAGAWLYLKNAKTITISTSTALIGTLIQNISGENTKNYSVGALGAIPFILCMGQSLITPAAKNRNTKYLYGIFSFILGMLVFYPFWDMWAHANIQRTTFVLLISMITLTSASLWTIKRSLRAPAITYLLALTFLLSGALSISFRKHSQSIRTTFITSIQHGEDFINHPDDFPIQFRVRSFFWKTAISDWLQKPVIGVGFIPEIPSMIEKDLPNNWESVQKVERLKSPAPFAGPHNSYLSILTRMGIIGLASFSLIVILWLKQIVPFFFSTETTLTKMLTIQLPINGLIYALMNVGLESPQNCLLLWLFLGTSLAWANAKNHFA